MDTDEGYADAWASEATSHMTQPTELDTLRAENLPSQTDMLTLIAGQLQWWLDYNAKGVPEVNDDMHVIPPCWPTRGQLAKWIEILTDATAYEQGRADERAAFFAWLRSEGNGDTADMFEEDHVSYKMIPD